VLPFRSAVFLQLRGGHFGVDSGGGEFPVVSLELQFDGGKWCALLNWSTVGSFSRLSWKTSVGREQLAAVQPAWCVCSMEEVNMSNGRGWC